MGITIIKAFQSKYGFDANNAKLVNLGTPTTNTDAANKLYVDNAVASAPGQVASVNGQTGVVVLDTDDINQGTTNLYYSDALVDAYLQSGNITDIAFVDTTLTWNPDDGTLEFPLNTNVTLQIGQENVILARNESGVTLDNGSVVRVTGASGNRLTVDLANNISDALSASTIGVATESIANNTPGYITTQGLVRGLDTSAWADGDTLYLNGAGLLTNVKPVTPLHLVNVGWVVRSHATQGSIFVDVKNGYELDELHDVLITTPTTGQTLVWDAANSYWENRAVVNAGTGITFDAATGNISVNMSAFTTSDLAEGTNLYYTDARVNANFAAKTTSDLTEGTNLYFTDARARAALSGGTGVTYDSGTGQISIGQDVATTATPTFARMSIDSTGTILQGAANRFTATYGADTTYQLGGGLLNFRGVVVDNTNSASKRSAIVMRSYSGTPGGTRTNLIGETARGTAAAPTKIRNNEKIIEIDATGYSDAGWITDLTNEFPAEISLTAAEDFTGTSNCGTGFLLRLQPKATTLNATSKKDVLFMSPAFTRYKTDINNFTHSNDITGGYAAIDIKPGNFSGTGNQQETSITAQTVSDSGYSSQAVLTTYRRSGSNYVPASTGDILGLFKFNGNVGTGTTPTNPGPATQVSGYATENWAVGANGAGFRFQTTPKGSTAGSFVTALDVTAEKVSAGTAFKLVNYADATARDTAIPSPEPGMMVYLSSTNKAQCYNGTAWTDLF